MSFFYRRLHRDDIYEGEGLSGRFDTRPLYPEYEVTTEPNVDLVDLLDIKNEIRVRHDDDDTLLQNYVTQATKDVEKYTCRALAEQTITAHWKLVYDYVWLPFPPLVSIDSVKEIDDDGTETTLTTDDYDTFGRNEIKIEFDSSVNKQLEIVFTAGYGTVQGDIPQWAKSAVQWQTKLYYQKDDTLAINAESGLAVPAYLAAKDYVYLLPE